jgi:microcystin-dependent protein
MDYLKLESGGFPLTTKTFEFLHKAHEDAINALTAFGGETYILKGVEVSAGNVSAGSIVYQGEILPFEASEEHATVSIIETIEKIPYNEDLDTDGSLDLKDGYVTRYAICGTGFDEVATFNFSELKPAFFSFLGKYLANVILPYTGSLDTIPNGFQLCDGTNGTPDISGAFMVGYDPDDPDYNAIAKQGGAKEVAITEAQIAQHTHTGSTNSEGSHNHRVKNGSGGDNTNSVLGNGGNSPNFSGQDSATSYVSGNGLLENDGSHSHEITMNNTGGSEAHENRPPYYTVAYMMFVG